MEIDEVVVNTELWKLCLAGDSNARKELAKQLTGLELYLHAMPWNPATETVVTLRDLEGANVVDYVKIGAPFNPGVVEIVGPDGTRHEVHIRDDGTR